MDSQFAVRPPPSAALPLPSSELDFAALHSQSTLLDPLPDSAIFKVDANGILSSWSPAVQNLLGYPESQFLGHPWTDLLPTESRRLNLFDQPGLKTYLRHNGSRLQAHTILIRAGSPQEPELWFILRDPAYCSNEELEQRVIERTLELSKAIDLLEEQLIEREYLESALLGAAETERERLGQDLHDGVCQQLTGSAMVAHVLALSLARRQLPEAVQARTLVEHLQQAAQQARDLAKGLHPVGLQTQDGLVAALEELCARTTPTVRCELDSPAHVELPPTSALHLYRIAQEAVRNALKHAHARHLQINLHLHPDFLELSIEDDGRGLDPQGAERPGMGLLNLQYRARALGAQLSIQSQPGAGTTVRCHTPIRAQSTPRRQAANQLQLWEAEGG